MLQLRGDVNALKLALETRNQQLTASQRAHKISTSISSLANVLARGGLIDVERASLAEEAAHDDVVAEVLHSIPEASAAGVADGVPTVAQLQVQWAQVQRALRVAAALGHTAEPGLISTALASIAAWLKVGSRRAPGAVV
jgi:hypothetical protein